MDDLWRVRPVSYEEAWRLGAEAERRLSDRLNAAATLMSRSVVPHDIDHLAISAAGIFVIDAKKWNGRMRIGRGTIDQRRDPRSVAMIGLRRRTGLVSSALASAGLDGVPVSGLLCLVNDRVDNVGHRLRWVEGIGVGNVDAVLGAVSEPGPLTAQGVRAVWDVLSQAFAAEGGTVTPIRAIQCDTPAVETPRTPPPPGWGSRLLAWLAPRA